MSDPVLSARGLVAGWARRPVLTGVDLDLAAGEIVAVIGDNGSGKSSLLWSLAGLLRLRRGTVRLHGSRLDRLPPERVAARGLRLLPQTRRVFPSMTVAENLAIVEHGVGSPDVPAIRRRRAAWVERFPELGRRADEPAGALSGGQQQLLAIGRVVTTAPAVLLLDEPSAGLAPDATRVCVEVFRGLAADGVAIALVEQDVALARDLAGRVLAMTRGRLA